MYIDNRYPHIESGGGQDLLLSLTDGALTRQATHARHPRHSYDHALPHHYKNLHRIYIYIHIHVEANSSFIITRLLTIAE